MFITIYHGFVCIYIHGNVGSGSHSICGSVGMVHIAHDHVLTASSCFIDCGVFLPHRSTSTTLECQQSGFEVKTPDP